MQRHRPRAQLFGVDRRICRSTSPTSNAGRERDKGAVSRARRRHVHGPRCLVFTSVDYGERRAPRGRLRPLDTGRVERPSGERGAAGARSSAVRSSGRPATPPPPAVTPRRAQGNAHRGRASRRRRRSRPSRWRRRRPRPPAARADRPAPSGPAGRRSLGDHHLVGKAVTRRQVPWPVASRMTRMPCAGTAEALPRSTSTPIGCSNAMRTSARSPAWARRAQLS